GFCAVNHVAVAARHLQAERLAERVLIVDWDVHHGNGTQDIFYADPSVHLLSLHQMPLFPGTGAPEETGEGPGRGTIWNVPLAAGLSRREHLDLFRDSLARLAETVVPDFILISAGYDALAGDPLASLSLEPEDFAELTREVSGWADAVCGGRVVAVLEGGYDPARTGRAVGKTLRALADARPTD
ncbi:MAG: histone deacetylase, partial [Gemmatimonadota bacterium]